MSPNDNTNARDARGIANFFLDVAADCGQPLTIMSLLKLIYFAHGWSLALLGRPLIRQEFEAWPRGPVVDIVYQCFKSFKHKPIDRKATRRDIFTGSEEIVREILSAEEEDLLREVFRVYGKYHAYELSNLTHEPYSPWFQVWEDSQRIANPGMIIPNELILAHFRQAMARQH